MTFVSFIGSVELGIIYALVALGLYVSYRVLDIADITTDGTFTLGAAVSAIVSLSGHPFAALGLSVIAGMMAGSVTAFLQTKLKVQPILAGILTMTALYTINLHIMGKSNLPLLKTETIYTISSNIFGDTPLAKILPSVFFAGLAAVFVVLFLRTNIGLAVRATGDNPEMVRASSINPHTTTLIGLMISNGIVALSGALLAQYQMFADSGMGIGIVVIGLASLIIGEVVLGRRSVLLSVIGVFVGSILYRLIIALALRNSSSTDIKLISSVIVAATIAYPAVKSGIETYRLRRRAKRDA